MRQIDTWTYLCQTSERKDNNSNTAERRGQSRSNHLLSENEERGGDHQLHEKPK